MTRKNNNGNITPNTSTDAMAYVMRIESLMNNDNIELYRELRRILSYDSVYVRDTYDFGHASMYLKNSFDIELGGVKIFSISDFGTNVSLHINGRDGDSNCCLPAEMMRALLYRVRAKYHQQNVYAGLDEQNRKDLRNIESMIQIPQNLVVVTEYDALPGRKKRPLQIKLISPDKRQLLHIVFCEWHKVITVNGVKKTEIPVSMIQYVYDMLCEREKVDAHRLQQEVNTVRIRQDMLNVATHVGRSY